MQTPNTLVIATRRSPLALWQAEHVCALLEKAHPGLAVSLLPMQTRGDKILDTPLAKIGGKALFVKELETALLDGSADIAVHSLKDVPAELPEGLALPCIMQREDPSDAWVSNQYASPEALPHGACVGTSSLRRRCQLLAQRPDLIIKDLRGNVGTRLGKLDAGDYDAIILASAGLKRLGLAERIRCALPVEQSLPAIGQGVLGIETRANDERVAALLKPLHDQAAADCAAAERGLNGGLAGGCQAPVAGHATLDGDQLLLQGLVGLVDGSEILREQIVGDRRQAAELGAQLAASMRSKGADRILASVGL